MMNIAITITSMCLNLIGKLTGTTCLWCNLEQYPESDQLLSGETVMLWTAMVKLNLQKYLLQCHMVLTPVSQYTKLAASAGVKWRNTKNLLNMLNMNMVALRNQLQMNSMELDCVLHVDLHL